MVKHASLVVRSDHSEQVGLLFDLGVLLVGFDVGEAVDSERSGRMWGGVVFGNEGIDF